MFTLNKKKFNEFDIRKAIQFVDYWNGQYNYKIKVLNSDELIDYFKELNLGNKLTEQNIKRLLRWKDPRMLTEVILSYPNKINKKVSRVIEKLEYINDFRLGNMNEDNFKRETEKIFPNGIIWQIFLFHIARPLEYPIADQNVFRAFSTQKQMESPKDWDGYKRYTEHFFEIAKSTGIINKKAIGDERDIKETVYKLKKIDNAFFTFGQFLKSYGKTYELPHNA